MQNGTEKKNEDAKLKGWCYGMKVTAVLMVHRPERVLYYLPENKDEVSQYISTGTCPEALKKYLYAFGTYDGILCLT